MLAMFEEITNVSVLSDKKATFSAKIMGRLTIVPLPVPTALLWCCR